MSESVTPARMSDSSTTGSRFRRCARDAISGTTPPNRACRSVWDATTFDSTRRSSVNTAAEVSSQEVSSARKCMSAGGRGDLRGRERVRQSNVAERLEVVAELHFAYCFRDTGDEPEPVRPVNLAIVRSGHVTVGHEPEVVQTELLARPERFHFLRHLRVGRDEEQV